MKSNILKSSTVQVLTSNISPFAVPIKQRKLAVVLFIKIKHLCRQAYFVSFNSNLRVRRLNRSNSLSFVGLYGRIESAKHW